MAFPREFYVTEGRLPRLFIVGAPRAGTTFLSQLVSSHDAIFLCDMKEPHYYGSPKSGFSYTGPGDRWVNKTWITVRSDYQSLYAGRVEEVLCDASTNYLYWPSAIRQIEAEVSNARYVVVLRNPVDRAFSMYCKTRAEGLEPADTILAAVESELRGERDRWSAGFRYLEQSRYFDPLSELIDQVGDRLTIVAFDELRTDPLATAGRIWDACGLSTQDVEIPETRNVIAHVKNPILRSLLVRPLSIRSAVAKVAPSWVVDRLVAKRAASADVRLQLDEDSRRGLEQHLSADLVRTETLIGRSL